MKRILTLAAALALAGCGGDDLEWLDAAVEDIGRTETAAAETATATAARQHGAAPAADGATDVESGGSGDAMQAAAPEQRRVVFVDVRQPDEIAAGHVTGAILIPHTELAERWSELEEHRDADIVLYCRTGRRSGIAEEILRQAGFENLHNGGGFRDLERRGVPTTR
jgi:phage shock protein E